MDDKETIFECEWGGTARCITSDGRNVNIAEELNRLEKKKWINVEERLPSVFAGRYKVRFKNGRETKADFYQDRAAWLATFNLKTSHWWCAETAERLDNVTHWEEKNELA